MIDIIGQYTVKITKTKVSSTMTNLASDATAFAGWRIRMEFTKHRQSEVSILPTVDITAFGGGGILTLGPVT